MGQYTLPPDVAQIIGDLKSRVAALETATFGTLTTWHDFPFFPGWANVAGVQTTQLSKDQNGQIQIKGVAATLSYVDSTQIGALSSDFWPTEGTDAVYLPCALSGNLGASPGFMTIHSGGAVMLQSLGVNVGTQVTAMFGRLIYR